jgi:hypothetical protein
VIRPADRKTAVVNARHLTCPVLCRRCPLCT